MPVAALPHSLNEFQQCLIGTWSNQSLDDDADGQGSQQHPLSYNVMPLPQEAPQGSQDLGYILKNHTYYETTTFNGGSDLPVPTTAPNRGFGTYQLANAVYYQQQVEFAQGPDTGQIVHTENGAWLNLLASDTALDGPYPAVEVPGAGDQPADATIAKQMAVPHGNSILALGSFDTITGDVTIPDATTSVLPRGVDTSPYETELADPDDYQNPEPDLALDPRKPLQAAVALLKPDQAIHWHVTTRSLKTGHGGVVNIPFEDRAAKVTDYSAHYWLLSTDGGGTYPRLAYTQEITMSLLIRGVLITFPHVTSNVITKVDQGEVPA